jgi:hypothetical protein
VKASSPSELVRLPAFLSPWREVPLSSRSDAAKVDEGRKRVLLIAASILASRKLAQYEGGARVPATISTIVDAIRSAEQIMAEIDRRWPARQNGKTA